VNDILWIDTPYSRCWKGGCISIGDEECVASRDRKITVTYDASCVGTTFLGRIGSTLISLTRLSTFLRTIRVRGRTRSPIARTAA